MTVIYESENEELVNSVENKRGTRCVAFHMIREWAVE